MELPWEIIVRRRIAWNELENLHIELQRRVEQTPGLTGLLVSEPLPTFTRGRSARVEDLLWTKEEISRRGATTAPADRGGEWTFHGPGQIVIYPILRLEDFGWGRRGVRPYLEVFRGAIAGCFMSWGISVQTGEKPFGLYANGAKIVSFGIGIQRGVTRHGAAVYYSRQSDFFSGIHPCGVVGGKTEALTTLGGPPEWELAVTQLIESIKRAFKRPGTYGNLNPVKRAESRL